MTSCSNLDHANVVVPDMTRSLDFYTRILGLQPIMDRELSGHWFEQVTGIPLARARCVILDAPGGGCRIELLKFLAPPSNSPPASSPITAVGLRHLAVRVDDLDARLVILHDHFSQTVMPVEVPRDIVKSGKRMCYIRDPDGAIIELCDYGSETPEFR